MTENRADIFQQQRPRLYGIAYRMLGSKHDCEDMLQEAYLRWHQVDGERIASPMAWLTTAVTRLCIDRLRASRTHREAYVGPWLPEPLVEQQFIAPDRSTEIADDLSVAFLVVLERLAPEERAAFLMHDVFDCEYTEIAHTLGKTEANCRQIVHRARERVRRDRPRFHVTEVAHMRILERFIAAAHSGDPDELRDLLAADATWTSDGGGKTKAALKVVHGAERVARFALGVWARYLHRLTRHVVSINGKPGLLMCLDNDPVLVISIDTDGTRILGVYTVLNPEKLRGIAIPSREVR
ncbi:MAG: RNA polymerase sigma-70 factor [Rudaea sp.]